MRVISITPLRDFWETPKHKDSEQPLKAWHSEAKNAEWKTPQDIKDKYGNASFIANNRVVFNIHGNKYRLVVGVNYDFGAVFVKYVGTHKQYDEIDATSV